MCKDRSLIARMSAGAGAALLTVGLIANAATAGPVLSKEAGQIAELSNQLGSTTVSRLIGKKGDNTVVVSPYGLGSALHLLLMGAARGSAAENSLRDGLLPAGVRVGNQDEPLKLLGERILGSRSDKLELALASAVFVPKAAEHSSLFAVRAGKVFDAPFVALDFKQSGALAEINAWVKDKTQGLIPSIIEQLEPDARFVLTNAVYFRGTWDKAFDPSRTAKAPFTRVDGSKHEVAMMDTTLPVELSDFDGLRAVWLPYDGGEVAMLVVAAGPEGAPTMVADALRSKAVGGLVAAAQKTLRRGLVQVRLPRFRAESGLDVTDALSSQIGPALAANSNYDAIHKGKRGPLQVIHRAVLEVSETGTVAAAATAVTSDRSLAVTPVFSADRPFAFAIVHRPTQAVLFAGYIADPAQLSAAGSTR